MTRKRKKIDQREAYATALNDTTNRKLNAFHTAFASAFMTIKDIPSDNILSESFTSKRFYQDNLSPEPKTHYQMLKHPHANRFKQAIEVEIAALRKKNTWSEISLDHALKARKVPLPTTWVFKYKFDENGYLAKYKACLCAKGDLQHTDQDTFAATLAA